MAQEYGVDPDRYVFCTAVKIKGLNYSNFSSIRLDKSLEEGREELTMKNENHIIIFFKVYFRRIPRNILASPGTVLLLCKNLKSPMHQKILLPARNFF